MEWVYERFLASKDAVRIDYSVLSVGVMTLGLIMVVEVLRHKLDHAAAHSTFYKVVLEGVNAELATLGIVEFFLHVMAQYYEDYDKAKKQVFADVHFLLFYTAILNALQSVLLHFVVTRNSQKQWVEIEMLELNHYVELREEFELVKDELDRARRGRKESSLSTEHHIEEAGVPGTMDVDEAAEGIFHLKPALQSFADRIRYPALKAKYNRLLVQVRFHELRVHFLQAYSLPVKFKISDYLKRSEQRVLVKLVHVSSIAWLLLTGVVNLLYYVLGMVSYKTADPEIISTAMIWLFFAGISLFVVVSWILSNKMKSVFKNLMHSETLWDVHDPLEKDKLAQEQKSLFWSGDPKLVIAAVQAMQVGYAAALSAVIIFWEEINDASIHMSVYVVTIFLCYAIFVYVTANIIPRYTLCTNLGQLVDECRLRESLAIFKLKEAKRRELESSESQLIGAGREDADIGKIVSSAPPASPSTTKQWFSVGGNSSIASSQQRPASISRSESTASAMIQLVKSDTASLRENLPESERMRLGQPRVKNRVKQVPDGVAGLRRVKTSLELNRVSDEFDVSMRSSSQHEKGMVPPSENRRARQKTKSAGVSAMALGGPFDASWRPEIPENKMVDSPKILPLLSTLTNPSFVEVIERQVQIFDREVELQMREAEQMESEHDNELNEPVEKTAPDDNSSVDSYASRYSDEDDVPIAESRRASMDLLHGPSLRSKLYNYFASRKSIVLSNVFGTMFAFFFVGQRVEGFLHSQGIANEKFTHFDFAHDYVFWLLFAWLAMFIIVSGAAVFALLPSGMKTIKEKTVAVAALLDILLNIACLVLLIVAEVLRCCNPSIERLLAEDKDVDSKDYYNDPPPCSCPAFGNRMYGGLGLIEPFTSLVALRIFRHWVARRIVSYLVSIGKTKGPNAHELVDHNQSTQWDPFAVFDASVRPRQNHGKIDAHHAQNAHSGGRHENHGEEAKGTAAELWEAAIGSHPEIAAQYGEFSGEMLRAMLGLPQVTCGYSPMLENGANEQTTDMDGRLKVVSPVVGDKAPSDLQVHSN